MEVIKIEIMYRDASNYKNHGEDFFSNENGISLERIKVAFEGMMDEPVMVQYYGITSISPIESEFDYASGDDHAFCEITDIVLDKLDRKPHRDILEVMELIEIGGDIFVIEKSKQDSILNLEKHLKQIKTNKHEM